MYAVGQENNVHYFAMQLINGCSLERIDYRTWSHDGYKQLIGTATALCDAISHAHDCGIIHRDIKPSNLLLDENGKVWITDFGLALCKSDARLTMSGDLIGTMNYMSPEQSQGKPVDQRTDVYSLGATLYELVTGKAAFPGQARAEVFRAIAQDEPIAPRKINSQCPYDLETIILKAMSKSRDDRYASASDMREDLERVLRGEPVIGRRPGLWQRGWRWTERHKALVSVAAVGLAATCLSITIGAAQVLLTRNALVASRIESQQYLATAEDNYWQGRNLVQRWNKEVIDKLTDIPGAEPLQARMLTDTIDYYQAFLAKAHAQTASASSSVTADPALAKDVIAARLALAAAFDASGQLDQAKATYKQAIEELKSLGPQDEAVHKKLAVAQNDLAVLLLRDGDATGALQCLKEALSSLTASATQHNDLAAAVQANLARAHQALADFDAHAAALEAAEKLYRGAIAQAISDGERRALQSELAAVLDARSLTLSHSDRAAAMKLADQAIALHEACTDGALSPLDWQRRLAASQHNAAVLLLDAGQLEAARALFEKAVATKLAIGQRTGLRPGTGADAALSYLALGRLESRSHNTAPALRNFEQAIAAVKHDLAGVINIENQLLLAESLASHVRLSGRQELRLELTELLASIDEAKLSDDQRRIVSRLENLQ